MMNKLVSFSILLFLLSLLTCGIGGPAGEYYTHVNKVYNLLLRNQKDAAKAAEEVYNYVEKNRDRIERASLKMKELTAKETEKVYLPVTKAVSTLIEYVQVNTKDEYPLGEQEKLISALEFLLK